MGFSDCVMNGGDYPGEHTFHDNITILGEKSPTSGYAAASVLIDLVFIYRGINY